MTLTHFYAADEKWRDFNTMTSFSTVMLWQQKKLVRNNMQWRFWIYALLQSSTQWDLKHKPKDLKHLKLVTRSKDEHFLITLNNGTLAHILQYQVA